jgi:hypothetical protein
MNVQNQTRNDAPKYIKPMLRRYKMLEEIVDEAYSTLTILQKELVVAYDPLQRINLQHKVEQQRVYCKDLENELEQLEKQAKLFEDSVLEKWNNLEGPIADTLLKEYIPVPDDESYYFFNDPEPMLTKEAVATEYNTKPEEKADKSNKPLNNYQILENLDGLMNNVSLFLENFRTYAELDISIKGKSIYEMIYVYQNQLGEAIRALHNFRFRISVSAEEARLLVRHLSDLSRKLTLELNVSKGSASKLLRTNIYGFEYYGTRSSLLRLLLMIMILFLVILLVISSLESRIGAIVIAGAMLVIIGLNERL